MKKLLSLCIVVILSTIGTTLNAQHRAPMIPFVDTIRQGNTAVIIETTGENPIPLPYKNANPKETYRAAKNGKKLTITHERLTFDLHSIRTVTEYVYEANSWKSSIISTDLGIRKETIYFWRMMVVCYVLTFLLFKKLEKVNIFIYDFLGEFIFFSLVIYAISSVFSMNLVSIFFTSEKFTFDEHCMNFLHLIILCILWAILPYIATIKIRKKQKDVPKVPKPSHQ